MAGILLFEAKDRGHVTLHSLHLLREAARRRREGRCIEISVVLPTAVLDRLPASLLDPWHVRELIPVESRACEEGAAMARATERWRLVADEVRRRRCAHVYWLELDIIQLQLFAGRSPAPGVTQSGMLFRPSVHYRDAFGDRPTARERIRDLRKRLVYRGMLANRSLDTVFTFDPWFAQFAQSRFRTGVKVVGVTEPAESPDPVEEGENERAPARARFLLPGSLDERKGVLQTLRALLLLPDEEADRVEVRLVGQLEDRIRPAVLDLIEEIRCRSRAKVSLLDGWATERQLAREYSSAHVILLPYQRFVGSSGVLDRALRAAKPVITQNYGLLGHVCRTRGSGLTVDTREPAAVASALGGMTRRIDGNEQTPRPAATANASFAEQVWDRIPAGVT